MASQPDLFAPAPTPGPRPAQGGNALREPLAACFDRVPAGWRPVTEAFRHSPLGRQVIAFVDQRVADGAEVYPADVFRALELTPLGSVKVVILGQDPYHGADQAHGLSFSVPASQKLPPSLRNIYKEIAADLGQVPGRQGDLSHWAEQGVLLLNTVLTVEAGQPQSHAKRGWEELTDALIAHVSRHGPPSVFLLWGAPAQRKQALIDTSRHAVFCANHPSPLAAQRPPVPFLGCRHFSRANAWLAEHRPGEAPIAW
ncbi:uracil-DNA glycosylase [Aquabacterium sp. A7-Y]|uniref:uracil-DNA glycosylase n=1 Tax=Aquabacterium sp. A7-Y TaxID=1349605 RepID=UPI00223E6FCA|nr:uracil-DNA glycosylase [Aquabacterium sp. A7-Y]MCW7542026.1 uracil-DNA glycosylase [Aquabacterium sp. A7-Y]